MPSALLFMEKSLPISPQTHFPSTTKHGNTNARRDGAQRLIRKLLEDRGRSEAVEGFVLGDYRTFQISLKDLEAGTGYDFGLLKNFDPLSGQADARKAVGNTLPVVVAIEAPQELVL